MEKEQSTLAFEDPAVAGLEMLVKCAQKGDISALQHLRQFLDDRPELWHSCGNLAVLVETAWISALCEDNPLGIESMKRQTEVMRKELAGEHPTAVEKLMVDQVIACWLQTKYIEATSANTVGGTHEQTQTRIRRLESAQRRYLESIKTLTTVRTLMPAGMVPSDVNRSFQQKASERA